MQVVFPKIIFRLDRRRVCRGSRRATFIPRPARVIRKIRLRGFFCPLAEPGNPPPSPARPSQPCPRSLFPHAPFASTARISGGLPTRECQAPASVSRILQLDDPQRQPVDKEKRPILPRQARLRRRRDKMHDLLYRRERQLGIQPPPRRQPPRQHNRSKNGVAPSGARSAPLAYAQPVS